MRGGMGEKVLCKGAARADLLQEVRFRQWVRVEEDAIVNTQLRECVLPQSVYESNVGIGVRRRPCREATDNVVVAFDNGVRSNLLLLNHGGGNPSPQIRFLRRRRDGL